MKLPYAEDINYWKTSKSSPDSWIEKSVKQIETLKGKVLTHAFGQDPVSGNSAYMIMFEIGINTFKIIQPVLPTYHGEDAAARRQATTLLYHEVKSRCLRSAITGPQEAFFQYMILPDGRMTSQASIPEIVTGLPLSLTGYSIPLLKDRS